jgi:hypothetical protein
LLAAFTCGCIAVIALITIHVGFVPAPEFGFVVNMYVQFVCIGALAAMVTGGIAARLSSRAGAHLDPRLVPV